MTEGEKMIWAAAFALELQRAATEHLGPGPTRARRASEVADQAVIAVRFGAPQGEFRDVMVESP